MKQKYKAYVVEGVPDGESNNKNISCVTLNFIGTNFLSLILF